MDITCKSSILNEEEPYEVNFKDGHLIPISKLDIPRFEVLKMAT